MTVSEPSNVGTCEHSNWIHKVAAHFRSSECINWQPVKSSAQVARAEPSTTHVYKFDRLRNGTKMAEGAKISRCSNPEDAQKEAAKLFGNHPYESFVLQEVDGQPVNNERAEPSRGAPQQVKDFWMEYYKEAPNFLPSEAACQFAEAYANWRHVVLLEACKGLLEELRLIRMKDTNAVYDPTIRVRAEAAIQQAERT